MCRCFSFATRWTCHLKLRPRYCDACQNSALLVQTGSRVRSGLQVETSWQSGASLRIHNGKAEGWHDPTKGNATLQTATRIAVVNSRPRIQGVHLVAKATDCASMRPTFAYGAVRMRARAWHGSRDAQEQTIRKEGCCALAALRADLRLSCQSLRSWAACSRHG